MAFASVSPFSVSSLSAMDLRGTKGIEGKEGKQSIVTPRPRATSGEEVGYINSIRVF